MTRVESVGQTRVLQIDFKHIVLILLLHLNLNENSLTNSIALRVKTAVGKLPQMDEFSGKNDAIFLHRQQLSNHNNGDQEQLLAIRFALALVQKQQVITA